VVKSVVVIVGPTAVGKTAVSLELAQTLETIDGVQDVRIHLVIPAPSLFTEEQNPVTASVTGCST
jgi:flagellar biosynthesis/type III secretory pathway M-ring protein FliF/YscJ